MISSEKGLIIIIMETKKNQLKWASTLIGLALTANMVAATLFQILLGYLILKWNPLITLEPWFNWVINAVCLYLVGFPIYLLIIKFIPNINFSNQGIKTTLNGTEVINYIEKETGDEKKVDLKKYSVKEIIILVFICLAATYLCNFISIVLSSLIGGLRGTQITNPLETLVHSSNALYTFIFACILAPVVEELMFRKVLIDKLAPFSKKVAIFVSAFTFALFHGNLYQVIYAFVLGLIFAHITISSGTIKYAVILHIIINTLGSVIIPNIALNSNDAVMAVIGIVVIAVIITGIINFFKRRKALFPEIVEDFELESEERLKISTSLLSLGMIVFWVSFASMMIYRTFFL